MGALPSLDSIFAPQDTKGLIILAIGLCLKDSSPVNDESKFCADRIPVSKRIRVPELPASIVDSGFLS